MTRASVVLIAAALAGCATPAPPSLRAAPEAFSSAPGSEAAAPARWWEAFEDPALNAIVAAAEASDDLAIAEARLAEASAGLRRARAGFLPSLSGSASASSRNDQSLAPGDISAGQAELGWTIDIFGQTRAAARSAAANAEAAEAARDATRLSARAAAARLYLAQRTASARAEAAARSVAALEDALALSQARNAAGLAPELDVAQARAALAAARIPESAARRAAIEARLSLEALLAKPPGALAETFAAPAPIPAPNAAPTLDAPAAVIARRPDLIAAERRLAAAGADVSAARRAYFPTLSVSALIGSQTLNPPSPFAVSGGFSQAAASLAGPIFSFGRLGAGVDAANARQAASAAEYARAAQTALAQVEIALAARVDATARLDASREAAEAAQLQADLARARYQGGLSPFLEVSAAERAAADADASLATAQGDLAAAFVSLAEALGLGAPGLEPPGLGTD